MKLSTSNFLLPDWLAWISKQHPQQIDLGLDRVKRVAERLDVLSFDCPVITVGGTNGKGSTIACLESIYLEAGYQVGVFNSPVLYKHNEYVRINKELASDNDFCQAYQQICNCMQGVSLTPFEFHTLAALIIFKQKLKVKQHNVLLLEVGLGGRLDAVNIIDADVAIVTSVSLDHQEYLGDTLEKIAREKAGIFRKGRPAIIADDDVPATLVDEAVKVGATVMPAETFLPFALRRRVSCAISKGERWHPLNGITVNIHPKNIAAALQAINVLQEKRPVPEEKIKNGLAKVKLSGRLEIIQKQPLEIHDVSHNQASVKNLYEFLTKNPCQGKTYAVFSMLAGKDIKNCVKQIQNEIDVWLLAPLDCERRTTKEQLAQVFKDLSINNATIFDSIKNAYQAAKQLANINDRIIVFGSFYTIAGVKSEIF